MNSAFVFGKLPAHGDFIARGLTPEAQAGWDNFLSTSLAAAREALGDAFDVHYDAAPAWRFALQDERGQTAGAIAPSIDRAGRRFPILFGSAMAMDAAAAPFAAACEDLIGRALGEAWTVDHALSHIAALPVEMAIHQAAPGWWIDGGDAAGVAPLADARPTDLLLAMLRLAEPVQ